MAATLRLLSWNILHGGGAERLPEIILSLLSHKPDVVVLTEFRTTRGSQIRGVLADNGLAHQLSSHGDRDNSNGILLAARHALEPEDAPAPKAHRGRWLPARVPAFDLQILGVHVPDDTNMTAKAAHWQAILAYARRCLDRSAAIVGDFNTGRRLQDAPPPGRASRSGAGEHTGRDWASVHGCEALLGSLLSLGFVDAWRCLHREAREYSWVSHDGQPRRIDTAYLSPALAPALQAAAYSHVERRRRLSDHAPLIVDLALGDAPSVSCPASKAVTASPGLFPHQPAAPGSPCPLT